MNSPTFLVARCARCARDVLAARSLGANDELVWTCSHCEGSLAVEEAHGARWVDARALDELGYFVDGLEPTTAHAGGGCRGGSCGVQQPE